MSDLTTADPYAPELVPGSLGVETVLSVGHWTDRLFSFTCSRGPTLRFENGQFVMIGLMVEGKPLLRAYSVASAQLRGSPGVLVHQGCGSGPLTSRLQHLCSRGTRC